MRDQEKIQCMECHCTGVLRRLEGNAILVPEKSKPLYRYHDVAKFELKPHGSSTDKQKYTYVFFGFLFWQTIILATNYAGLEKLGPTLTFKTLSCGRSYKDYSKICADLCPKIHEEDVLKCQTLCRALLSDGGEIDGVCPFEKTCPHGCPCPFFECESVETREMTFGWYYNETDPLFELKKNAPLTKEPEREADQFTPVVPKYRHLSRLVSFDMKSKQKLKVYRRVILVAMGYHAVVTDLIHLPKNTNNLIISTDNFDLQMKPLFYNGENYLIDGHLRTFVLRSGSTEFQEFDTDHKLFLRRNGFSGVFNWYSHMSLSVAGVYDDKFWFCGTMKYPSTCYFMDLKQRGQKSIFEAKGKARREQYTTIGHGMRRRMFIMEKKLTILNLNLVSRNIEFTTMESPDIDWSSWTFEDPQWEYEFRNKTFAELKDYAYGESLFLEHFAYDTHLNDFYPIPDRKGILFVAIFRHREFERGCKFPRKKCESLNDHYAIWTRANYFIILYRYSHGRFLQVSKMETDFSYEYKPYKKKSINKDKMAGGARMRVANQINEKKVLKRGNVPTSLKETNENKAPVGPYLLALFIFVVCGSAIFEIIMKVQAFAGQQ
ncbi:Oidioi.mRNA.OKI2018_I69.chr2.g4521.t1.cds [Oikopleura dioica]|uniref:Oidioi.mRNA.OKI2018_I69.chr2.g4521.t1.cds n=1 Tax=Oikopleura dioica TaxID=34765 RepID=A0ABN7T474_OIKDI|nr:Oidioi.mRNA.OKI2018_I69.chr2.g4521.t1.cds [Oikopleura dioica]